MRGQTLKWNATFGHEVKLVELRMEHYGSCSLTVGRYYEGTFVCYDGESGPFIMWTYNKNDLYSEDITELLGIIEEHFPPNLGREWRPPPPTIQLPQ